MRVSVVVCSYNGSNKIGACLTGLMAQSHPANEIIVVDDGSTDATADVARRFGVHVLRHDRNRGPAAARNTGIRAATGDILAFTDDDCIPHHDWIAGVVAAHERYQGSTVVAIGGPIAPATTDTLMLRFTQAVEPHAPLELDLAADPTLRRRLRLYFQRMWSNGVRHEGPVCSLAGANLTIRRSALTMIGLFEDTIPFAGEDEDVCRRIRAQFGTHAVVFCPAVIVDHVYEPDARDVLRRARAYGRGAAQARRRGFGGAPPVSPILAATLLLMVAAIKRPGLLVAALAVPLIGYPHVARPRGHSRLTGVVFGYLRLVQEAATLLGFAEEELQQRHQADTPEAAPKKQAAP